MRVKKVYNKQYPNFFNVYHYKKTENEYFSLMYGLVEKKLKN